MPDRNPLQSQDENVKKTDNTSAEEGERFETDTQKIMRRHLENEDDVITDEDIASIRVGMTPSQPDEATAARFEDDDAKEEAEDEILGDEEDRNSGDIKPDDDKLTPWDTIDENK